MEAGLRAALAYHWHPVCQLRDLPGPVGVRLLGRDLAVARLGDGSVAAFADRCPHRSTRLSVGSVDGDCLRCAYHGWTFDASGRCTKIPSMPDGPIPGRATVESFSATVAYDLVWVRLDDAVATTVPPCPAFDDPASKVVAGVPYTWPVAAGRRVENFVDLAHFAFVHDGSLGRRDQPVPPLPEIRRDGSELRFGFDPPLPDAPDDNALVGASRYRMPMPCTVDIEFPAPDGRNTRRLWMTASPVDDATSRTFWCLGRTDDLAGDDRDHLAFQDLVIGEDEPVVCAQAPGEMLLDPADELSVRTDRVSIEYRRWLRELAVAALDGPAAYAAALGLSVLAPETRGGTRVSGARTAVIEA